MSLTWLKPVSQQRYWTQKWQPWTVELAGKKKGKRRSGVWTTNNVDIDTVQVIQFFFNISAVCSD